MAFSDFTPDQKEGIVNGAKLAGAWTSVAAVNSAQLVNWAQAIASFAAAIYTVLLIIEFMWKKVVRPFCEWRGWIKPKVKPDADDE